VNKIGPGVIVPLITQPAQGKQGDKRRLIRLGAVMGTVLRGGPSCQNADRAGDEGRVCRSGVVHDSRWTDRSHGAAGQRQPDEEPLDSVENWSICQYFPDWNLSKMVAQDRQGSIRRQGRKTQRGGVMEENRIGERRFSFHSTQSFPFRDASGKIYLDDRRRTPDRRLNNIWLELVTLKPSDILFDWSHKMWRSIKKPAPRRSWDAGSLLVGGVKSPATHRTEPPYAVIPLLSVSSRIS